MKRLHHPVRGGHRPSLPARTRAVFPAACAGLALSLAACASPEPEVAREDAPAGARPAAPADPSAPARGGQAPVGDPTRPGAPPPDQPGQGGKGGLLDELAADLGLREQEQRSIARHYYKTGLRYFEAFDYRKAAESFQRAVDAYPNDPELRAYLLRAQLLAGDRQAEFETVSELLREQREVSIEMERAELKRIYADGEELMKRAQYARAITRFEQVLEKIRWFPFKVDTQGFEDGARRYVVQARRLQREQDLAEAEQRERRALRQATEEQERYRRERQAKTEQLVRKAFDLLQLQKFDEAERTIDEVLAQDPGNDDAIKLRELTVENRHYRARERTYDRNFEEHEGERLAIEDLGVPYMPRRVVIFPGKDRWDIVRQRQPGIAEAEEQEPDWVRDYRQVLKSRKVTLNFPQTPFAEVVTFLQDITGLNITVSSAVDQEATTVQLRLTDIPLEDALKIILEQTQLAMTFANETLMITPPEEARGQYNLEIYDVQDLLSRIPDFPGDRIRVAGNQGGGGGGGGGGGAGGAGAFSFDQAEDAEGTVIEPDQLEEILRNAVGEDAWEDPATIEIHKGQVIVNQTREIHGQLREVLRNLRRNTGLFVQVEARFINMTDDFLRDVGVDFRGLGLGSPTFGHTPNLVLDPGVPSTGQLRPADDLGFGRQIPSPASPSSRASRVGVGNSLVTPAGTNLFGSSMFGGRTEHVLDGGAAFLQGTRLNNAAVSGVPNNQKGSFLQASILDPFQISAIIRAEEENGRRKIVHAPTITAANRQRVHVSVITQRAYISDYELSSGGTGLVVAEVADPVIEIFQEGIVLDVRPTISSDRKYITLDVRPTLASLVGGTFQQIAVNLGTISNAAINVNIEVPQITLQEAFTSVTLPDGGTALLGGFRQITAKEEHSGVPFVDRVPLLNRLFSRDGELNETASLLILVSARIVSIRDVEAKLYNVDED